MATNIHNHSSQGQLSLGKFGDLLFVRQTPMLDAETHPSITSRIASRFNAWRERRFAAAELSGMSDRELADIGVTRQDIPTLLRIRR